MQWTWAQQLTVRSSTKPVTLNDYATLIWSRYWTLAKTNMRKKELAEQDLYGPKCDAYVGLVSALSLCCSRKLFYFRRHETHGKAKTKVHTHGCLTEARQEIAAGNFSRDSETIHASYCPQWEHRLTMLCQIEWTGWNAQTCSSFPCVETHVSTN